MELHWHTGRPGELDAMTLYANLRLRVDVFVVEQECPYAELDGRDLEPGARWIWATDGDQVVATLRVLPEPPNAESAVPRAGGTGSAIPVAESAVPTVRIGRVATARKVRSAGVGGRLMRHALADIGAGVDVVLAAQSPLETWYHRFGFSRSGKEFFEDGIAHVPMRRPAQPG